MAASALLSIALILSAAGVPSQAQADGWGSATLLSAGTQVRVTRLTSQPVAEGSLVAIDDLGITVNTKTGQETVQRANVLRIEKRVPSRAIRNGFLSGAAFGLVLSVATVKSNRVLAYPFFTFGWGGVGALGGAIGKSTDRNFETVFLRR